MKLAFNTREFARYCGHPTIGPGGLKCPCCGPSAAADKRKMRRSYRRATKLDIKRQRMMEEG